MYGIMSVQSYLLCCLMEEYMDNISAVIAGMKIDTWKGGGYRGRVTLDGKRKAFYGKTKVEIKNKAKDYLMKVENGYKVSEKIVLNDFIEHWLKNYKLNKIEPSSYSRLWGIYQCQIKNTIGKEYLHEISTQKIQRLIDTYANPNRRNIKPLARSGLKKIKNLLNPCLEVAVREDILKKNPCKDVIIPLEGCIEVETKEQFTLTEEELKLLKEGCLEKLTYKDEYVSRNRIVLLLLVNLGLRIGEMVALKWSDIDYRERKIRINKIMQTNLKNGETGLNLGSSSRIKKSSKTRSGVRNIPLNVTIEEYLRILKEYDKRNGIKSEYVACTQAGNNSSPINFSRTLESVKKRMKLNSKISLHTLRHTFGSHLVKNNIGVEVVSNLMGHSNTTVTYNNYIHVLQEEGAEAMSKVSIC